jgi:hypothetical protein
LLAAALGAVVLSPLLGAAQESQPVEGASGLGDSYWPLDGNGGIDVISYRIRNHYDFDDVRIKGRTTIRLKTTQDLALNRPGKSGDSIRWEGWSHVREYVEEVSGRAA